MRNWMVAYLCCVAAWVASDAALQWWDSFLFQNFMRLPLLTALEYLAPIAWWGAVAHFPFWSVGTLVLCAYAAVGFLPVALVPLLKRRWLVWLSAAFVFAHLALWVLALVLWVSGPHP